MAADVVLKARWVREAAQSLDRTQDVFDYTLRSAALKDPAPMVPFYREIARRPELTQQLMNVLGGTAPARSLFNAANMMRAGRQHQGGHACTSSD